jgi:thiol-disulfide isomerase/thioredoxin
MRQPLCLAGLFLLLGASGLPAADGDDFAKDWAGRKAVVVFFLNTDCPVSNGYAPEMARLAKAYGGKDVLFWGVHCDPDVSADDAARHARDYRLDFPIRLDPEQRLARLTGARVTPEAALLTPDGKVLYHGRIDDRYTPEGKRRDEARTHDLEAALDAVLAGKPVAQAETKAFGCPLPRRKKAEP